jgi:diaminohydroxyphosphoribosylaminopyrimidine deaminase/5-amino-6-(5-phosphoribosylamino)uracil reductase
MGEGLAVRLTVLYPPESGGFFYGRDGGSVTSEPMRQALRLAARGRGRTHPNPRVGAVVVADGRVVGQGYHEGPGLPHAEVRALDDAGPRARRATLYVTLEPCRHHGRTPPCTEAILRAGVARVVIAVRDPHPAAGGGARVLAEHGVAVEFGDGFDAAVWENRAFFFWTLFGRPWVQVKVAVSVDGRVATRNGPSAYLTGEAARRDVHRQRGQADAVLVGVGTVLRDDPRLTCRIPGGRDPVRVVVDTHGRLTGSEQIFHTGSPAPTLVYTGEGPDVAWERRLFQVGGEVVRVEEDGAGHVHLGHVLRDLGERGLLHVLVEAGPTVQGSLVDQGLVDEWTTYVAPLLIGGTDNPAALAGRGADTVAEARSLRVHDVRRFGDDVRHRAIVRTSWEALADVLGHY